MSLQIRCWLKYLFSWFRTCSYLVSSRGGWIGFQWLLTKKGIGASNHFESAAFIRSAAGVEYPDIQYHFLPLAVRYDGKVASGGHGFQAHVGPMRSLSRGSVTLRDAKSPGFCIFHG